MEPIDSDLLLTATAIPELLATFLIMGTITNAVLPVASRIGQEDKELKASSYINLIILSICLFLAVVIVLCLIFTGPILQFFTSEAAWQDFTQAGLIGDYINVTRILLLTPLFFAMQSVLGVFLTIHRKFFVYSLAGLVYNIGMIAGLLVGVQSNYYYAAIGMLLGSSLSVLVYFVEARRSGLRGLKVLITRFKEEVEKLKPDLVHTWKLFLPAMLTINGVVVANLMIKNVASGASGQITAFDIGLSIQNVFFTVITSISAVFFPSLAKSFLDDEKDRHRFWAKLKTYSEYTALISLSGSILTFLFAPVVMWLFTLFNSGQGTADYIVYIARIASLSFVFQSVNEVVGKYFYVKERLWPPMIISTIAIIFQISLIYFLIGRGYDEGFSVGLSMLINGLTIFTFSYLLIRREYLQEQGIHPKYQNIRQFSGEKNRDFIHDKKTPDLNTAEEEEEVDFELKINEEKDEVKEVNKYYIAEKEERGLTPRNTKFKLPIKKI